MGGEGKGKNGKWRGGKENRNTPSINSCVVCTPLDTLDGDAKPTTAQQQ